MSLSILFAYMHNGHKSESARFRVKRSGPSCVLGMVSCHNIADKLALDMFARRLGRLTRRGVAKWRCILADYLRIMLLEF
jgi:hypothetical protein